MKKITLRNCYDVKSLSKLALEGSLYMRIMLNSMHNDIMATQEMWIV